MYSYAGSTNCFYTDNAPDDAVEITDERYQELLAGMAEGKVIVSVDGYPEFYVPTAEQNKATASSLLASTDWTTIADIGLPTANPRLSNQSEFIAYRQVIRQIAVYPPAGEVTWPTAPTEVWKGE